MRVSAECVGTLIGRGGETIKSLEQKTSARIEVSREDEKEADRRVTISGRTDSVEQALEAILEVINSVPKRGEAESDGEGRRVIQVAQAFVGMIIGKGGEKIKAMSRDSGARIEVSRDDGTDDRDITIKGEQDAVDRAAAAIEEVIRQASMTFGPMCCASDSDDDDDLPTPPPGFEACEREGWLHHKKRDAYYEKRTGRLFWLDPTSNLFKDLHHGLALDVRFVGAAALGTGSAASSSTAPPPKHVVIPDLHRVGQAMSLRLDHLDRPAVMLGVFGGSAEGVPVDTVARGLHEKLVRRLGASRSEWPDDHLFGALTGALFDVGGAHGSASAVAAVALAVGRRVLAVASPGTSACLLTGRGANSAVPSEGVVTAGATTCFEEVGEEPLDSICIALAAGSTEVDEGETAIAVAPHLFQGRPRAASAALLRAARRRGARGALAAACARIWVPEALPLAGSGAAGTAWPIGAASGAGAATAGAASAVAGSTGSTAPAEAARRPPVSAASVGSKPDAAAAAAVPKQVRARQILVRHWRGGPGTRPVNPITRKPVSRSQEEAEARLLGVLDGLVAEMPGGADRGSLSSRFSAACKESSECQSALKGGEFAGDLGWLDQVKDAALKKAKDQPGGPKSVVKPTVPAPIVKAAFELEVGEISDFITSDLGVHLLLRTA